MSLGKLVVSLSAESAEFIQGLDRAAQAAARSSSRITSSFAGVAKGILAAEAVSAILSAGVGKVVQAFDTAGAALDAQASFGTTAEKFYEMQHAIQATGASAEPMGGILAKLNMQLAATGDTSKGTGALLKAMGLDLKTVKSADPVDALKMIAVALQGIEDPATRARVGTELLGKGYKDAADSLANYAASTDKASGVTQEMLEAADALGDKIAGLGENVNNTAMVVAGTLSPQLGYLADIILGTGDESASTGKILSDGLTPIINAAARAANFAAGSFKTVALGIAGMGQMTKAALTGGDIGAIRQQWYDAQIQIVNDFTLNDNKIKNSGRDLAIMARQAKGDFSDVKDASARLAAEEKFRAESHSKAATAASKAAKEAALFGKILANIGGGAGAAATKSVSAAEKELTRIRDDIAKLTMSAQDAEMFKFKHLEGSTPELQAKYKIEVDTLEADKALKVFNDEMKSLGYDLENLGKTEAQKALSDLANKLNDAHVPADKTAEAVERLRTILAKKSESEFAKELAAVNVEISKIGKTAAEAQIIDIQVRYKDDPKQLAEMLDANARRAAANTAEQVGDIARTLKAEAAAIGATPLTLYIAELREAQRLNPAITDDIIAQAAQMKGANIEAAATYQAMQDRANDAASTISGGLGNILRDTKNASAGFKALTQSVADLILKYGVLLPLENSIKGMFSNAAAGYTEVGGGTLSDIAGSVMNWAFGGGKAMGGGVGANSLHEVAENGPETLESGGKTYLLTGSQGGNITPNHALQSSSGGVVIQQTLHIDARGADESSITEKIRAAVAQGKQETLAAVQSLANRGGSFAMSTGRR
jgi:hypothetical protein